VDDVLVILKGKLGEIDLKSKIFDFVYTDYYQKEMGDQLKKVYISFEPLFYSEKMPEIKIYTNLLEKQFSVGNKRKVNLDPGYIEKAKLILVTTKNYSHRIYLGSGIFGDLQYRMMSGSFQWTDWTYPDYKEDEVVHFFKRVRDRYCREVDKW
jgi:hypothetical protein